MKEMGRDGEYKSTAWILTVDEADDQNFKSLNHLRCV